MLAMYRVPGTVLWFVMIRYYRRIEASSSSTDPVDDKLEPLESEVCGSINRTSAEQLNSYRDIGTYVLQYLLRYRYVRTT